jgi:hypothetical protein
MEQANTIKVGKYIFTIMENVMIFGGDRIISHTFRIGGDYNNCISVSYTYNNNKPVSGKIPHALYEPECTVGSNLEKGTGTIIMLKTLLNYVYNKIPTVSIFNFEDMSNIDCVEKDLDTTIPRPPKKPLNLAYFSIAYYSETWYERNFNAKMNDKVKYAKYRDRLEFLTNPNKKLPFIKFLEIAQPSNNNIKYLEQKYNTTKAYRDFFESIPKSKRCTILYSWLSSFMEYYLKDVYSHNWEIDINEMRQITGGSRSEAYPAKYRLVKFRRKDMV